MSTPMKRGTNGGAPRGEDAIVLNEWSFPPDAPQVGRSLDAFNRDRAKRARAVATLATGDSGHLAHAMPEKIRGVKPRSRTKARAK